METGFLGGGDGGVDNVPGRGEIGFAGAEADDRTAGSLQGFGLRVNCKGGGFCNGGDAL